MGRLIGILSILFILATDSLYAQNTPPEQLRAEAEETARLLAKLLQAGRLVIEHNQTVIDDIHTGNKGFTPEVFERQVYEIFRQRTGIDLGTLSPAPARASRHACMFQRRRLTRSPMPGS